MGTLQLCQCSYINTYVQGTACSESVLVSNPKKLSRTHGSSSMKLILWFRLYCLIPSCPIADHP